MTEPKPDDLDALTASIAAKLAALADEPDAEDEAAAEEEEPLSPEAQAHADEEAAALEAAVLVALAEMVAKEMILIPEGAVAQVAVELTAAALDARNPKHALKKLSVALFDCDHVEEIFADDRALKSAFRRAMGG